MITLASRMRDRCTHSYCLPNHLCTVKLKRRRVLLFSIGTGVRQLHIPPEILISHISCHRRAGLEEDSSRISVGQMFDLLALSQPLLIPISFEPHTSDAGTSRH
jgi:hypothetical protein